MTPHPARAAELAALRKLTRAERRALAGRLFDRLSHKAIAAQERIKPRSSMQRVWRANRKLRKAGVPRIKFGKSIGLKVVPLASFDADT